ncbi:MAG: DUF1365 family protein [bacterium]|nr:DUF1365 family protein [bacterium]
MKSKIFIGQVIHKRLTPVRHSFRYPLYWYAFDLDELPALSRVSPWFGYNRLRPVSIHDRDYLRDEPGSIREKLLRVLPAEAAREVSRVVLVTSARFFHYVFNPVSFYFCYDAAEKVRCVVAEVNNTFHDRHVYVLDSLRAARDGLFARAEASKAFHVSPFFTMRGAYEFWFTDPGGRLDIRVNLHQEGRPAIVTRLWGESRPFTAANLAAAITRHPLSAAMTMPRILWQAGRLYFQKRLPAYPRPEPASEMTIAVRPMSWFERACMKGVFNRLERFSRGELTITSPWGGGVFGEPGSEERGVLRVKRPRFFTRSAFGGSVGFGESYVDGDWDSDDLTGLLTLMCRNLNAEDSTHGWLTSLSTLKDRLYHRSRINSIEGSRRNISEHYDLSNEFYQTFLDPTMMYSCAMYKNPGDTLEDAQYNKLDAIIARAGVKAGDHVLEIGSGWGGLARRAVETTGCHVTTITLSQQQKRYVQEMIEREGLSDRIEVRLCDYRDLEGRFDAIVSIEMLEAVGHEHYGTFFSALDRLLKPGGRAALQTIAIPDQRYDAYRRRCDWIQKHIFPGGHLPCLSVICATAARHSRLRVTEVENIGPDYAKTLAEWRERFNANLGRVAALGFDERFQRKWNYYLSYCEAGFAARILDDLHIVLRRAGE